MASTQKTSCTVDRQNSLPLRPADVVMNLERLGSLHPYRLSFMRILMRKIMNERWKIERTMFDLDEGGYGTAIYSIDASHGRFCFVVFAHQLDADKRSDRVIADQWDMTVTLCEGDVDEDQLRMLRQNVPLQEAGRVDARSFVLSRANKSSRNFDYVVGELAAGRQPALEKLARVGYLYRTTAVYGSGKFGMADWLKVHSIHADFARPFAAEMFTCFMIRQFSLEQAEFIAHARSPDTAVPMDDATKRYMGIGNATGLGMAPYLINHPQLISRWIEVRETVLARIVKSGQVSEAKYLSLQSLLRKAARHFSEISTDNDDQNQRNKITIAELEEVTSWIDNQQPSDWSDLLNKAMHSWSYETQELISSLLSELYPELVDEFEDSLCVDESMELVPEQRLSDIQELIENHYGWALKFDFDAPGGRDVFWYRSMEKSEPRLGHCGIDPGEDKAMKMAVAYDVRQCYGRVRECIDTQSCVTAADFAVTHPDMRSILRRIQTMSRTFYGDIHVNLIDKGVLPIHLLRCKLSFFGVSKFDPKSRLWVRNTMFQGAPLASDIGEEFEDDWYFPIMPETGEEQIRSTCR
ncbi:MAG: hypothetical protein ACR2QZ_09005 [Woeseiaceae bacterium]